MKNLLDADVRESLLQRFARLDPTSERRWGKMTVGEMLCHVGDPIRIALGELEVPDQSSFFTRSILRRLVLAGFPAPKGKIKTFPEIDHALGGGTPPEELDADRDTLKALIGRLVVEASKRDLAPSPMFGRLSGRQYGRLMYVHMDHHLKQFGV